MNDKNLIKAGVVLIVVLCVYFGIKSLSELRSYSLRGSGEANVITLTGHGEVQAVPDIAGVYFTIQKDAKMVKEAQEAVAKVEKAAVDFLKKSGVEEKDIKTENASFYPKYEYRKAALLPCDQFGCPPSGREVIVGYTASESISVKVRDTDMAGEIIQGLGGLGVSNLNGPNFTIDDEEILKAEARRKAIAEAKAKAEALAKDLGVRLGRVANFSESGSYYPLLYKTERLAADGAAQNQSAPASLPKGENTITSDVTISYEIR